jgi:hypothetical protein
VPDDFLDERQQFLRRTWVGNVRPMLDDQRMAFMHLSASRINQRSQRFPDLASLFAVSASLNSLYTVGHN